MNKLNIVKCVASAVVGGYAVHTAYKIKEYVKEDENLNFESALVKSLSNDCTSVKSLISGYFSTVNYN